MPDQAILIITIGLALAYSYGNGLNDAANALATVISTRVLTPTAALILGGSMNLLGALTGTAVAKTIGKGIVDPEFMSQSAVMAAILAAVIWVFLATRWGFPVSVSHSLVAAVLGAGVAAAGFSNIDSGVMTKVLLALAFSPVLGFGAAFIFMTAIYWIFRGWTPNQVTSLFSKLQILSAAFLSYSHGKNDAQNAMGIMALAWAVYYSAGQDVEVLLWMKFAAALTMAAGVAIGGWRVIRTPGNEGHQASAGFGLHSQYRCRQRYRGGFKHRASGEHHPHHQHGHHGSWRYQTPLCRALGSHTRHNVSLADNLPLLCHTGLDSVQDTRSGALGNYSTFCRGAKL